MRILRVAYLLGSLNIGGTEILMLDVFYNHNIMDYSVIAIHRKKGALFDKFKDSGVKLYQIFPRSVFDFIYLKKLRSLLITEKIEVVHAQQFIDAFYAWLAVRGKKIKIVLTHHGFVIDENKISKIIRKFIYKHVNLNLFVSNYQMSVYVDKYRAIRINRKKVLMNGVSTHKYDSLENKSIRDELKVPQETRLLVSVGSFTHVRDQLTICKFIKILDSKINFKFLFVGKKDDNQPELFDSCFTFCKDHNLLDRVIFLGNRNDVPDILNETDIFVYSSAHDTFGIAVIEAMIAGLPLIVNDWDVMKEITENGKRAMLYKTEDEYDLLKKFNEVMSNYDKYKIAAENTAKWAREKFSIEKHISNLSKIYREISAN